MTLELYGTVMILGITVLGQENGGYGFRDGKDKARSLTLSEPMKQLEADLRNHALNYNNNPIIKWCLANTQAKVDVNGNI